MFFSLITKNLHWEILNKNLVTFNPIRAFWRLNRLGGPLDTPKILETVLHQTKTTFLAKYHNFC